MVYKGYLIVFLIFCQTAVSRAEEDSTTVFLNSINQLHARLPEKEGAKPPLDLYQKALVGFYNILSSGHTIPNNHITLIDFRIPSNKKRMWIIDLNTNEIVYYRLVAHGKNTGEDKANTFSNRKNSLQSSLGFYLTAEKYMGKHGLSLRLDGLEKGINDNARERAIVMHSANYVSREFINKWGRLGRSYGCPAIATRGHKEIIQLIANGSLLFIYYPDENYEIKTNFNDLTTAARAFLNSTMH